MSPSKFIFRLLAQAIGRIFRCQAVLRIALYTGNSLRYYALLCPYQDLRTKIWRKMGHSVGDGAFINGMITIMPSADSNDKIVLGERVATASGITFILQSSPNNSRLVGCESVKETLRHGSIIVGNDTWIGAGCVIHPGVCIGKNCIVGAMSNVTRDIPDNSVAYGNPAKVRRCLSGCLPQSGVVRDRELAGGGRLV